MTFEQSFARQVDTTMRELIVLLLQRGTRLTPETIDLVRKVVLNGMIEGARLSVARELERRRAHTIIPGPWDDEPTEPERPTNRPKKPTQ